MSLLVASLVEWRAHHIAPSRPSASNVLVLVGGFHKAVGGNWLNYVKPSTDTRPAESMG